VAASNGFGFIHMTDDDMCPLHIASDQGHYKIVCALIKAGAASNRLTAGEKVASEYAQDDGIKNELVTHFARVLQGIGDDVKREEKVYGVVPSVIWDVNAEFVMGGHVKNNGKQRHDDREDNNQQRGHKRQRCEEGSYMTR